MDLCLASRGTSTLIEFLWMVFVVVVVVVVDGPPSSVSHFHSHSLALRYTCCIIRNFHIIASSDILLNFLWLTQEWMCRSSCYWILSSSQQIERRKKTTQLSTNKMKSSKKNVAPSNSKQYYVCNACYGIHSYTNSICANLCVRVFLNFFESCHGSNTSTITSSGTVTFATGLSMAQGNLWDIYIFFALFDENHIFQPRALLSEQRFGKALDSAHPYPHTTQLKYV